jgi:hypothetical protein
MNGHKASLSGKEASACENRKIEPAIAAAPGAVGQWQAQI